MDESLMWPEEVELRGLTRLVPQPDGSIRAEESDPLRCAELRSIIDRRWAEIDARFRAEFGEE